MPFPQPEPEPLTTFDRVLFWALVTTPPITAILSFLAWLN